MGTVAIILQVLEATPQLVAIISSGYSQLKSTFSATDQAQVEAAITAAYAKLEADVARVEGES